MSYGLFKINGSRYFGYVQVAVFPDEQLSLTDAYTEDKGRLSFEESFDMSDAESASRPALRDIYHTQAASMNDQPDLHSQHPATPVIRMSDAMEVILIQREEI
jgi:hypothetical protein